MLKKRILKRIVSLVLCVFICFTFSFTSFALTTDYYGPGAMRGFIRANDGSLIGGRSTGHQIEVWRSTTNGASWSLYSTIATNPNVEFGDICFVLKPGTNTMFSAWREYANGLFSVVVGKSTNNGLSWAYDSTIISGSSYFVGAPFLMVASGNLQCYYDSEKLAADYGHPGFQWVAMVSRNGYTGNWTKYGSTPVVASRENNQNNLCRDGLTTVVNLGNNTLMAVTEGADLAEPHPNVIYEIRSYNNGQTWDYANRRVLYQSAIDPITGGRFNAYCPFAIKMSDGTVAVTFCTDEDFASPPDASNMPVENRRSHIKLIRSTNSTHTTWTAPLTIWNNGSLSYLPSLFENVTNELMVNTALFYGNQQYSNYVYNGTGTIDYKNGTTYSGAITGLLPNGQGTFNYADGSKYTGAWSNGIWSGQGTFYWPGTNPPTFTGTMTGIGNGNGTIDYKNGDTYTGPVVNLLPNGQGTKNYGWGGQYNGNFVNGQWSGQGTMTWSAGHTFTGTMTSEGNGTGVFYDANTKASYNANLINWTPYPI